MIKLRKCISIALSAALIALAIVPSIAAYEKPKSPNNTQLDIITLSTVDVQTSLTGVRDYSSVVNTNKSYKLNSVIFIALNLEVKNIAKTQYINLQSIADEDIELAFGSETIDFTLTKASSPVLITDAYSGFGTNSNINNILPDYASGNTKTTLDISSAINYDAKNNLIKLNIIGAEKNSRDFLDPKKIAPSISGSKIALAALKAKDGKETVTINNKETEVDFFAGDKIKYKIILTGIVNTEKKGDLFAAIKISGAEKFRDKNNTTKLVIKDKFEVYKNIVFPSDVLDNKEQASGSKAWVKVDGRKVAQVNPKAQDGTLSANWAGGVSRDRDGLVSEKVFYFSNANNNNINKIEGQNGLVVYTIATPEGRPIVSAVSEFTYYDGDEGASVALFVADEGKGYARRIGSAIGGNLIYLDSTGGNVAGSREIASALRFFGMDTGLNSSYKIMDDIFEKQGSQSTIGTTINCSYKTIVTGSSNPVVEIIVDPDAPVVEIIDPEQEIEVVEEIEEVEEIQEEIVPEEDEEIVLDDSVIPNPRTGDTSAKTRFITILSISVLLGAAVLTLKKIK